MSHSNSPSLQGFKRCIFFAEDGVSVINLPLHENETFSLIDSAGGNIRLLRFSPSDAERITAALQSGATFRFVAETLHVAAPSGRMEFSPRQPDDAAAKTPALPGPREIQRVHAGSDQPPAP
jgi:hypothetical protein